ncbi:hypothetical protein [Rhodopseudomonas palustris]|uniref:hypothetical protein n=1 Tax=Rhodopseudomonas palustris TaxID=1076 RepID=UPI00131DCE41|nr:hypothetical protein [Rhodopseudomonas palustris]
MKGLIAWRVWLSGACRAIGFTPIGDDGRRLSVLLGAVTAEWTARWQLRIIGDKTREIDGPS